MADRDWISKLKVGSRVVVASLSGDLIGRVVGITPRVIRVRYVGVTIGDGMTFSRQGYELDRPFGRALEQATPLVVRRILRRELIERLRHLSLASYRTSTLRAVLKITRAAEKARGFPHVEKP